jgi:hypothetical protein
MTDWPIIRCAPGPTDAELQAIRDEQHRAAMADWLRRNPDLGGDR